MPYKSNSTNKQSKENTGDPTGTGKGQVQDIDAENATDALHEELENKYTDENGEPDLGDNTGNHPNRNTDKPSIDKPRYS